MAHFMDEMSEVAIKLVKQIEAKFQENKKLGKQIIAGARENADYATDQPRWSPEWYIKYIQELKTRL